MVEKALVLQNREDRRRINSFCKCLPTCFSTQSFYILKLKMIKSEENNKGSVLQAVEEKWNIYYQNLDFQNSDVV